MSKELLHFFQRGLVKRAYRRDDDDETGHREDCLSAQAVTVLANSTLNPLSPPDLLSVGITFYATRSCFTLFQSVFVRMIKQI
jgi:hypothetical protein